MYALPRTGRDGTSMDAAARENVNSYQAMLGQAFPPAATETLLAALAGMPAAPAN
jgi:hypothetical protein